MPAQTDDTSTWQYLGPAAQTVSDETITIYRGPVVMTNSIMNALLYVMAVNTAFTKGRSGQLIGTFLRGSGNVFQDGVSADNMTGTLGCVIALAVDTVAQTMTVTAKGVKLTVINYRAMGYFRTLKVV